MRLAEIKNAVIQRRNLLVAKGLDYTIDDLLSEKEVLSYGSSLSSILEQMISDKGLSANSSSSYSCSVKRLSQLGVNSVKDVSPDSVQGLCKMMKREGWSDSTVNSTLTCLGSLWRYCESKGLVEGYLFSKFKFWKKYRIAERRCSLTVAGINAVMSDFLRRSVVVDAAMGQWCYTDEAERDLMNRRTELFAQCCFLLSYHMQGLAFADLVRIKSENISLVEVDGKEYYRIKGMKRKKTNAVISDIVVEVTDEVMPLFHLFVSTMDKRDGYFLPVLRNNKGWYNYDTEKKMTQAVCSCSAVINRNLRSLFDRLGFDSEGVSFYCARHSFATHYIQNGGNPVYLADMMARSVNGIFRYVQGLTSIEHTIRERKRVFK